MASRPAADPRPLVLGGFSTALHLPLTKKYMWYKIRMSFKSPSHSQFLLTVWLAGERFEWLWTPLYQVKRQWFECFIMVKT